MLDPTSYLLALMLMKRAPDANPPKSWEALPSARIQTGVGFHPHEPRLPAWALEMKLGSTLAYGRWPPEGFTLRPALGWGMGYNISRPLEHFGLLELGLGAQISKLIQLEYIVGGQVGVFDSRAEPAFRHALAAHLFAFAGLELQHYVTGPQPDTGRPRQVARLMVSFDLGWYLGMMMR